jgi:hypothetical protein
VEADIIRFVPLSSLRGTGERHGVGIIYIRRDTTKKRGFHNARRKDFYFIVYIFACHMQEK